MSRISSRLVESLKLWNKAKMGETTGGVLFNENGFEQGCAMVTAKVKLLYQAIQLTTHFKGEIETTTYQKYLSNIIGTVFSRSVDGKTVRGLTERVLVFLTHKKNRSISRTLLSLCYTQW